MFFIGFSAGWTITDHFRKQSSNKNIEAEASSSNEQRAQQLKEKIDHLTAIAQAREDNEVIIKGKSNDTVIYLYYPDGSIKTYTNREYRLDKNSIIIYTEDGHSVDVLFNGTFEVKKGQ